MGLAIARQGGAAPAAADTEVVPAGAMNGVNKVYTLPAAPTGTLVLMLNGVEQNPGPTSPVDYVLSGLTVTFTVPPRADDWILAIVLN